MPKPKSSRPRKRLNLDLPESVDKLVEDLSYETDCDSKSEFIRKSVLVYDHYLSMRDKDYELIAFDDQHTKIPEPEPNYDEKRIRINTNISVNFDNIVTILRDKRKEKGDKASISTIISESIILFNSMYEYISQGIGIGYMKGEEKFKVIYM